MILRLALRNTLRNRRRSILTAITVVFGTMMLTIGLAWVNGIRGNIIRQAAQSSGHVRIVTSDFARYESMRPLDEAIPATDELVSALSEVGEVHAAYPRIQVGMGISDAANSQLGEDATLVMGAPLEFYTDVMELPERLLVGRWFSEYADGWPRGTVREDWLSGDTEEDQKRRRGECVLGRIVAEQLGIDAARIDSHEGAEVILLSQNPWQGRLRVVGIVDTGNGLYDKQVFVTLNRMRWMGDLGNGAFEVLVYTDDADQAHALSAAIAPILERYPSSSGLITTNSASEPVAIKEVISVAEPASNGDGFDELSGLDFAGMAPITTLQEPRTPETVAEAAQSEDFTDISSLNFAGMAPIPGHDSSIHEPERQASKNAGSLNATPTTKFDDISGLDFAGMTPIDPVNPIVDTSESKPNLTVSESAQGAQESINSPELEQMTQTEPVSLASQIWSEKEPIKSIIEVSGVILGTIAAIIVFITALGVLNTMLMSVLERTAEIGVLRAMGMKRKTLVGMFVTEAILISMLGGILGAGLGSGIAIAMRDRGIDLGSTAESMPDTLPVNRVLFPEWEPYMAVTAASLALVMALLGSLFPAIRAMRIEPVTAMRSRR